MRTSGSPTRLAGLAVGALLVGGALAGCGSASSTVAEDTTPASPTTGPTTTTSPPTQPVCAKVWKSGSTLPAPYRGCVAPAGWVKAQVYQCEDGQRLITYAHVYYAAPGRSISRAATTLAKDHGFRHTMAACGA